MLAAQQTEAGALWKKLDTAPGVLKACPVVGFRASGEFGGEDLEVLFEAVLWLGLTWRIGRRALPLFWTKRYS